MNVGARDDALGKGEASLSKTLDSTIGRRLSLSDLGIRVLYRPNNNPDGEDKKYPTGNDQVQDPALDPWTVDDQMKS